jgi:hypothetical protein
MFLRLASTLHPPVSASQVLAVQARTNTLALKILFISLYQSKFISRLLKVFIKCPSFCAAVLGPLPRHYQIDDGNVFHSF